MALWLLDLHWYLGWVVLQLLVRRIRSFSLCVMVIWGYIHRICRVYAGYILLSDTLIWPILTYVRLVFGAGFWAPNGPHFVGVRPPAALKPPKSEHMTILDCPVCQVYFFLNNSPKKTHIKTIKTNHWKAWKIQIAPISLWCYPILFPTRQVWHPLSFSRFHLPLWHPNWQLSWTTHRNISRRHGVEICYLCTIG